jgi:hypothetical protein
LLKLELFVFSWKVAYCTPNQLVVYTPNNNPGTTGGTQGDPSQGTWSNNGQQQQTNGPSNHAADPSRGALRLSERAPVQAVETDANSNTPTKISNLMASSFCQTQVGNCPPNCMHVPTNSYCILCDREVIMHAFLSSQNDQYNTETRQDLNLFPCSLAIIKFIQNISSSLPLQVLFDFGSDNTFIH